MLQDVYSDPSWCIIQVNANKNRWIGFPCIMTGAGSGICIKTTTNRLSLLRINIKNAENAAFP
jgi:hypothetical protein